MFFVNVSVFYIETQKERLCCPLFLTSLKFSKKAEVTEKFLEKIFIIYKFEEIFISFRIPFNFWFFWFIDFK